MTTLYLDCAMGAAGDMLTGALLELLPEPDRFVEELNALGLPDVEIRRGAAEKCGIRGTQISVCVRGAEEQCALPPTAHHAHEHTMHPHRTLPAITELVESLSLPQTVRKQILAVYGRLAEAESIAHGKPVEQIHFHEVGSLDAIADITAVCLLMDRLAPQRVVVSPIHLGSGQVHCAHGIVPVPAPATVLLLRGAPVYSGSIRGELCTPTGAALLMQFATEFGSMPLMRVEAVGYGMGKKDFEAPNCVRALLGRRGEGPGTVLELQCNLDDMTPEALGFATERLLQAGALDVWTCPIGMKKSRPAVLLSVLCREADRERLLPVLFRHTTTLGVRELRLHRHTLERSLRTQQTPYGSVRVKTAVGYGVCRSKPEYEDLARIALEADCSLAEAAGFLKESPPAHDAACRITRMGK